MPPKKVNYAERHGISIDSLIRTVRALSPPTVHEPITASTSAKHAAAIIWFDSALKETSEKGLLVKGHFCQSLNDYSRLAKTFPDHAAIMLYLRFRLVSSEGRKTRYVIGSTLKQWWHDLAGAWTRLHGYTAGKSTREKGIDFCKALAQTYSLSIAPTKRANLSVKTVLALHHRVWVHPEWTFLNRLAIATYMSLAGQTGLRISSLIYTVPSSRDAIYSDFILYVSRAKDGLLQVFGYYRVPFSKGCKEQIVALGQGLTCSTTAGLMVILSYIAHGGAGVKEMQDMFSSVKQGEVKRIVFSNEM
jgi:hypothetical protein